VSERRTPHDRHPEPASLAGAAAVEVRANAKVNLRLRILARETTGFHQLETIFLRLDLADVVRVRRARGHSLDISGDVSAAALGPTERNLAWRAARAWAEAAGTIEGWAIELEKHIPVGGGLGGGSADAGAVLRALDAMSPQPLGESRLLAIAASLGADVPFLATTRACALAWGRGERLLALEPPPRRHVVLLVPAFGVNTAEAYGWLASHPRSVAPEDAAVLVPEVLHTWAGIAAVATNDFETVVSAHHPVLASLVGALENAGCAPAMLSGSGAVVFGVLPDGVSEAPDVDEPCVTVLTRSATRVEPVSVLH
jgi:4-diphosphocytidyl-2-C-methyl-D-erythritol kinase